jgi:hypothetical protein
VIDGWWGAQGKGRSRLPAMTIRNSHFVANKLLNGSALYPKKQYICLATTHADAQIQFYPFIQTLHAMNTARDTNDQTHHLKEPANADAIKISSSQNPLSSMKKTIDL